MGRQVAMTAETDTRLAKVRGMMTLLGPAKLPGMVVKLAELRQCATWMRSHFSAAFSRAKIEGLEEAIYLLSDCEAVMSFDGNHDSAPLELPSLAAVDVAEESLYGCLIDLIERDKETLPEKMHSLREAIDFLDESNLTSLYREFQVFMSMALDTRMMLEAWMKGFLAL